MISGLRPLAVYTPFVTLLIVSFKGLLYNKVAPEIIYYPIARRPRNLRTTISLVMHSVTVITLCASLLNGLGKSGKIERSVVVCMHDYVTQLRTTRCGKAGYDCITDIVLSTCTCNIVKYYLFSEGRFVVLFYESPSLLFVSSLMKDTEVYRFQLSVGDGLQ